MRWRRWIAGGVAVLSSTSIGAIATNFATVTDSLAGAFHYAKVEYVDTKIKEIADGLEPLKNQIGSMSLVLGNQVIRGLEADLEKLNADLIAKQDLLTALPNNPTLRADIADIQHKIKETEGYLGEATCARGASISEQSSEDCRKVH